MLIPAARPSCTTTTAPSPASPDPRAATGRICTVTFTGVRTTDTTYIIGIKYSPKNVIGQVPGVDPYDISVY